MVQHKIFDLVVGYMSSPLAKVAKEALITVGNLITTMKSPVLLKQLFNQKNRDSNDLLKVFFEGMKLRQDKQVIELILESIEVLCEFDNVLQL